MKKLLTFNFQLSILTALKSKLITNYEVTSAAFHDSNATEALLEENDKGEPLYADSACTGAPQEEIIKSREMENRVCENGYRNRPLTEEQKANTREKSRFRSRVEHLFVFMEMSMNEMYINCIGIKRATAIIGLINLTYNMFRKLQLKLPETKNKSLEQIQKELVK
jgi:IS5 family transposase